MTDESLADSVVKLDCNEALLPELIQAAREQRRAGMEPLQRVRWLRASREVDVQDESLSFVLDKLNEVKRSHELYYCNTCLANIRFVFN